MGDEQARFCGHAGDIEPEDRSLREVPRGVCADCQPEASCQEVRGAEEEAGLERYADGAEQCDE